jgi:hypothetical protein
MEQMGFQQTDFHSLGFSWLAQGLPANSATIHFIKEGRQQKGRFPIFSETG